MTDMSREAEIYVSKPVWRIVSLLEDLLEPPGRAWQPLIFCLSLTFEKRGFLPFS